MGNQCFSSHCKEFAFNRVAPETGRASGDAGECGVLIFGNCAGIGGTLGGGDGFGVAELN